MNGILDELKELAPSYKHADTADLPRNIAELQENEGKVRKIRDLVSRVSLDWEAFQSRHTDTDLDKQYMMMNPKGKSIGESTLKEFWETFGTMDKLETVLKQLSDTMPTTQHEALIEKFPNTRAWAMLTYLRDQYATQKSRDYERWQAMHDMQVKVGEYKHKTEEFARENGLLQKKVADTEQQLSAAQRIINEEKHKRWQTQMALEAGKLNMVLDSMVVKDIIPEWAKHQEFAGENVRNVYRVLKIPESEWSGIDEKLKGQAKNSIDEFAAAVKEAYSGDISDNDMEYAKRVFDAMGYKQ